MNEIHSKYSARGLTIVAVSNETPSVIEPWLNRKGVTYGTAQSSSASRSYGVRGIPNAFLISADGTILWRGHPGSLTDAMIEQHLGGTAVPGVSGSSSSDSTGGGWWIWMILVFGIFFVVAVGWFWHSTREKIPDHLRPGYMGPPPGAYGQPQAYGPPPGAHGPPPGAHGPPPGAAPYPPQQYPPQQQYPGQPAAYPPAAQGAPPATRSYAPQQYVPPGTRPPAMNEPQEFDGLSGESPYAPPPPKPKPGPYLGQPPQGS
ncbi:MAG: redoxin domain-containing protein [Planctomycetes bacterium]|nr:redoxin domain-containing protein [Planctomycetota bacterium]